jgi:hypothetical protein
MDSDIFADEKYFETAKSTLKKYINNPKKMLY